MTRKKLLAVRLPEKDYEFLEKWAATESKNSSGPEWTVSFLIQKAVRELIERQKK
jgi:hypothetical protein